MSIPEVHDCIRSYGRRAKIKILQQFIQAESIAEHIGRYLNSENKARKPWDFYPELFREEREQFEESKQEEQVVTAAENRRLYAAEFNRRRHLTAVVHYGRTVINTKELLTQTFGTDARLEWSYRKSSDKKYSTIPENDARITQDGFVCTPNVDDIIEETSFRCDLICDENGQINPDQETVIIRLEKRLNDYVDETLIPGLKDSISGELIKDEYVSKILKNEENITTLQKIIEDLQYVAITISSFECDKKVIEIGSTVKDITFTWKINKTPETLLLDGEEMDVNSSSYRKTGLSITSRKDFTLKAVDNREATASKTVSVNFYNGVYYGVSAIPETVDSTFIVSLQKTLQSTKTKTFNIASQDNDYIWYALPSRYGTPTFNVGGFDGGFTRKEILDYTNPSGYTEEYWVYRSDNCNLGQKTVKVS